MKSRLVILSHARLRHAAEHRRRRPRRLRPAGEDNASIAQYAGNETPTGGGDVLGDQDAGTNAPADNGGGDTSPGGGEGDTTQPARQVEAGANTNSKPPVHGLRRDPGPARRHRAPERRASCCGAARATSAEHAPLSYSLPREAGSGPPLSR